MEIGDNVIYIRNGKDGISEGVALLKGITLDPDNRLIVLLKEGDSAFNTFYACLNPTEEFKEKFKEMIANIGATAKEGNEKAKAIIDEYNGKVIELHDELLGKAIEIK